MTTPENLLHQLADAILAGGDVILAFVARVGQSPDEPNDWPFRWTSDVVRRGIGAELSIELLRWIILRSLHERGATYEAEKVVVFIDAVYAEQKTIFDRNPQLFRLRCEDMPKPY